MSGDLQGCRLSCFQVGAQTPPTQERLPGTSKQRESDQASGQRHVTRSERWRRQERVGPSGFGSIGLEKRIRGGPLGATAQDGAVRAVKQIDMDTQFGAD